MKHNAFRKELYSKREDYIYDTGYETSQHDMFIPMLACMVASGICGGIIALAVV